MFSQKEEIKCSQRSIYDGHTRCLFITMATMKRKQRNDTHSQAMKGRSQSKQCGLLNQGGARLQVSTCGRDVQMENRCTFILF